LEILLILDDGIINEIVQVVYFDTTLKTVDGDKSIDLRYAVIEQDMQDVATKESGLISENLSRPYHPYPSNQRMYLKPIMKYSI